MIVMAMLAFFVFVSRYYVTCRNRQFEQSRWMIVVAKKQKESDIGAYTIKQTTDYYKTILRA